MKLIFVTSTLGSGGAERVLSILANDFCKRGNEVEVIALTNKAKDYYALDKRIRYLHADKECCCGLLSELRWFRRHVAESKPDCVIAFMEAVYEFVLLALFRTNIPVISSERKDPRTLGPLRKMLRWILLPTAAAHVVQTKYIRDFYRKSIRKKTYVIFNPVDEKVWQYNAMECGKFFPKEKRIVSVGRLYPQKNQQMLIRAFAKIATKYPEYKLVIFGEGYLRKDLEHLISCLGLQDRVLLPGRSSNVIYEVAKSEIFCLSSNFEGMSNAMIEAICVGIPVISTKVSGTDELIINGKNGLLVDIGNVEELAQALEDLLKSKTLQCKFYKEEMAMSHLFRTSYIADQWQNLFCKVIKKNNDNK